MYLPLLISPILKRDDNDDDDIVCNWDDYCYYDTGWYRYGRWLVVAAIAIVFILIVIFMRRNAARRVQMGRAPMTGTGWMVPPSYHQSQRQYTNQGPPPAPAYNQTLGQDDAGYYDVNGTFIHHSPPGPLPGPPSGPPPGSSATIHPPTAALRHQQFGYELGNIYLTDRKSSSAFASGTPLLPPYPGDGSASGSGSGSGSGGGFGLRSNVDLGGASEPPVDNPENITSETTVSHPPPARTYGFHSDPPPPDRY